MKKKSLLTALAACSMLFSSCGQEDILSKNNNNKQVSYQVSIPGAATRAGMPEVSDKTRRCIMQVVNAEGSAIVGDGMKQTVAVTSDQVTFSFPEPEEEYSVVFWADYVESMEKDFIYNTTTLPTISYAQNKNNMFTAAGDAFCGVAAKGTASVTLKRPFNKIVVGSTNQEAFGAYENIAIGNFNVPDGYSIFTKQCTGEPKSIRLENKALENKENGVWASFFVFAPVNETETQLTLPITLTKAEGAEELKFEAQATVPADGDNLIGNMNIPELPKEKIEVSIDFDPFFGNEEKPLEFGIGSYINAKGKVVKSSTDDAIAIVFAVEALDGDKPANYAEALQNKTIKGYAVALENAASARQAINTENETLDFSMPENVTNGSQSTKALLDGIGSNKEFTTTYNTWVTNHALDNSAALSGWYIPTYKQMIAFAGMLFKIGDTAATGNEAFKALPEFANGKLFDRDPIVAVNYATCTINGNGNISVVQFLPDGTAKGTQAVVTGDAVKSTSILCRPMLTIFNE